MSIYEYDNAPTNPHHGGKMTPTDMMRYIEELEVRLDNATNALKMSAKHHRMAAKIYDLESAWAIAHNAAKEVEKTIAELTGGNDE